MKIVLSLGGSLIYPDSIDTTYIKKFRTLILKYTKKYDQIAIIVGGGQLARKYQKAGKEFDLDNYDLDMLGIMATRINAELIRTVFSEKAYEEVIYNPSEKINTKKNIILGAGYKPGYSTDRDAVLLAENIGCKEVINLTNVDYVYDRDPKQKDAKPIKELTWNEFTEMFGTEWKPGKHTPFDPVAAKEAKKHGIKAIIVNGKKIKNLDNLLSGKEFKGTVIK